MNSNIEEKIIKAFTQLEIALKCSGKRSDKDNFTTLFVYLSKDTMNEFREICKQKKLEHSEIVEELIKDWVSKNEEN